jgi:hypothetical protein
MILMTLAIFVMSIFRFLKENKTHKKYFKEIQQIKTEITAVNSNHVGIAHKMIHFGKKISAIEESEFVEPHHFKSNYQETQKLLNKGVSIHDVAKICDLSEEEMDILTFIKKE